MYTGFHSFENAMFTIVPVIVAIGFITVIGLIIIRAVQGASQWKRNNESPVLTVDATVVTKRNHVSYHRYSTGTDDLHNMTTISSMDYYVTFEVASKDRLEFAVRDTQYGMLAEKDFGKLTFQGTRLLGFQRRFVCK